MKHDTNQSIICTLQLHWHCAWWITRWASPNNLALFITSTSSSCHLVFLWIFLVFTSHFVDNQLKEISYLIQQQSQQDYRHLTSFQNRIHIQVNNGHFSQNSISVVSMSVINLVNSNDCRNINFSLHQLFLLAGTCLQRHFGFLSMQKWSTFLKCKSL